MQQARCGFGLILHGAKRHGERRVERLGGGTGDRLRRRLRERSAHLLDRLARDVAEAGSQARMLERRSRRPQRVEVFFRHQYHYRHLSSTFSIALIRNGPAPIKISRPPRFQRCLQVLDQYLKPLKAQLARQRNSEIFDGFEQVRSSLINCRMWFGSFLP
jgi:hypothetical protein